MDKSRTLNFFGLLKILWKGRWFIALSVCSVTLLAILYSFTLPNIYQAEATIMPLASSASANSNVSGLFSLLSGGGSAGNDTKSFLMYLRSKKLRSQIVEALNLLPVFFPDGGTDAMSPAQKMEAACNILAGMATVENDRVFASTILIRVKNEDPFFATKIVQQYLVELQNFISNNSLTQSKRYRLFLEEQVARNKEEFLKLGVALANFYGHNPVSEVGAKLNVPVGIQTEEGVRNFKNYDEFKRHFDILQKPQHLGEISQEIKYVQDVPHHAYLKYLTTQQQVLEASLMTLAQSYSMAKLEEAKEEPSFQILDEPIHPQFRVSPDRRRIALGSFAASFFVSLVGVLYRAVRRGGLGLQWLEGEPREELTPAMIAKHGMQI